MHPDPPTWCSIVHRHEHESQVPHCSRSTYFRSDPSDRPSIGGVVGSTASKTVPFERNAPKPFPSDLSCDCVNSAKYTLSPLYSNRTAGGSEGRSVSVVKVKGSNEPCALRGKVIQVDTKKKWKTRVDEVILDICRFNIRLREVTPDGCLGVGSQLMFQPGVDVDYTTKDERECCGGKDQYYVESDE